MQTLQYPYKPKAWLMLLGAVLFGAMAFFMTSEVQTNDRGLILNGIIHLSVHGATIFYWCMAAVAGAFVAVAIPMFFVALVSKSVLTLTATDLIAPRSGFSRRPTVVRLSEVKQVVVQMVQRERFIKVSHAGGTLNIAESMLPSRAAFDELHAALVARTRGVKAA